MPQCGRGDPRKIHRDQEGQYDRLGVAGLLDHYEAGTSDDGEDENDGDSYGEDDNDDDSDGDVFETTDLISLNFFMRYLVLNLPFQDILLEVRLSIDDGEQDVLLSVEQRANAEYAKNVVDELLQQYPWPENTMEVDVVDGEQQFILLSVNTTERGVGPILHQSLEREYPEEDLEEDVSGNDN